MSYRAVFSHDRDLLARHLAAIEERDRLHRYVVPIVDCIRQMRREGLTDSEIAACSATRPTRSTKPRRPRTQRVLRSASARA